MLSGEMKGADALTLLFRQPAKVELVVRTAIRSRPEELPSPHPKAVDHCRKEIRRELIRRDTADRLLYVGSAGTDVPRSTPAPVIVSPASSRSGSTPGCSTSTTPASTPISA